MSITIEHILGQRRMNITDFKNSDDDTIREILSLISPPEISRLCATSRKFNRICKDQSFWRVKVKRDYGIQKKYGSTWKETAINMHKVNMINLNNRWINGRTYSEIVEEVSDSKDSMGILFQMERQYFPDSINTQGGFVGAIFMLDGNIYNPIFDRMDRDLTNREIETLEKIYTSEFAIIFRSFYHIVGLYSNLPNHLQQNYVYQNSTGSKIFDIVLSVIDLTPYIMFFSSLTTDELNDIYDEPIQ